MATMEPIVLVSAALGNTPSCFPHRRRLPSKSEQAWNQCKIGLYSPRTSSIFTVCLSGDKCIEDSKQKGQVQAPEISRRGMIWLPMTLFTALAFDTVKDRHALASDFVDMPALRGKDYGKPKMRYPDYTLTDSGLQYKDLRLGSGPTPKEGETVVVDWDGYTIGYYGRIFEARNKAKGGSFEGNQKDYLRIQLGNNEVIPAFEEALSTMNLGSVRRIIVPPELGYPDNDFNKKGPKPTTFSGQRALAFVLQNQNLIDKTLLFDIELLKISST